MKIKKRMILFVFHVLVLLFTCMNASIVQAKNKAETEDGKIIFHTEDTGATTGIRWTTVGFTIRRNKTGGDPIRDNNYGTVWLKEEYKVSEPSEGGKVKVVFTIPKADVDKALRRAGLEKIKENDKFYLNGIFQVKIKGELLSKKHYTFHSISTAQDWGNASDFWDRFDVECTYHAGREPVKVRYELKSGRMLEEFLLPESEWIPSGEETVYKLELEKTYKGKKYKLYQSYYMILSDTTGKKRLLYTMEKDPDFVVQERSEMQEVGGIKFVGVMVPADQPQEPGNPTEEKIESDLSDPMISAVIRADDKGNEKFEILDGIPTTEDLYVNVIGTDYLAAYEFVKKVGKENVSVRVSKTYKLNWSTANGEGDNPTTEHHSETKEVTKTINVPMPYSYWEIKSLDYFTAEYSVIENYALPGGKVKIPVTGYTFPEILYQHESDDQRHVFAPKISDIHLGSVTINGGSQKPSVPSEDFEAMVAGKVPDLEVKNDTVTFDGMVIMSGERVKKNGERPLPIPESNKMLTEYSMYLDGQTIAGSKRNGEFESKGSMVYRHIVDFNSRYQDSGNYEIAWVNPVVIHTPVVCDAKIEDKKAYNQMITPDKRYASLVLDLPFRFFLPTDGSHREIKGYGERDYDKYTARRQVKFSFDVYKGSQYTKADTWIQISEDETEFRLPMWVDEGKYSIECRSIAINADTNGKIGCEEDLANFDYENYVATDMLEVEISGRIYGLNLFDISDYPIWESVFRKPNSLERSGFCFTVGTKDKNGEPNGSIDTLTLVNGSHPAYKNIGVVKTGYVTRFELTTVGNMTGTEDYIKIKPTFYYVSNDGFGRQEVDLYYSETIQGEKYQLVKAGSELDKKNRKSYRLGDPYFAVSEKEMLDTASVMNITLDEVKKTKRPVFTYVNIMIPGTMRTFIGKESDIPGGARPDSISFNKLTSSKQRWFCEYYIPSEVHIVKKDFDVMAYAKENGINYQENFWLKDGYILINFDIETITNGKRNLSYINSDNHKSGYCNMWKKEGFAYQKTDYQGHTFEFQDGDYMMYYATETSKNSQASQDYRSAGTH